MKNSLSNLKTACWLVMLFSISWVVTPGYAQTCGLVSNSGFENDLTGWSNSGSTAIVTDVHSGTKAARTGTGQGGLNGGTLAVTAGQQLTFSVWAKISGSPSWAGVGLDFLNASGTEISEINLQVTAATYTQRTLTQAVPAGATQARIWTWKSGAVGNLFVDDFCVSLADAQAPSIPTGLASSAHTQTSFTLTWTASTDNVGVTGYEVFRNGTSIGTPATNSFPVTGLTAGTTYAMRVRARDAAGNFSAQSTVLNVTTPDTQAPSVPTGLASSAVTQTGFTLNWTASSDNIGVTGYEVFRNGTSIGTPATNSFPVTGLTAGTTYPMTVRARDAAGNFSAQSTALNVTTTSSPPSSCGAITNNGFESGLSSWTNNGNTVITTNAHSGSGAIVTGPGEGGVHYAAVISASPGQTITFSVWGKLSGTPTWAGTGFDYLDATGTEIGEGVITVTGTTYVQQTVTSTAPAGTATVAIWTWKSGTSGNLFLDDFCLTVGGGGGGNFDVTINKATQFQTIDGFGFFGAQDVWWSTPSTLWSDAWGDQVINDLGITIWRTEFYPPSEPLGGTQDADWNKELPVIQGLRDKANAAGVNLKFIFTVWSPPASMKVKIENDTRIIGTPHPGGTKNGGALDPTKYVAYANYLKTGIQFFKDQGIDLYAISPQNEPFFTQSFNSCKYLQEWYPQMLNGVIPTVKAAFPNVKIFGSENMLELEGADENWQWFFHKKILDDATARNRVDILAVHGYSDGVAPTSGSILGSYWNNHKTKFAEPMNKPQWMTETSGYADSWTGDPGAFSLALDIMSGLNNGNMSGWVFWQGSENPGNANIGEFVLMNGLVKGKKYYASKQFYRYIRPGAVRVSASSANANVFVSAYQHSGNGTHTVVLINNASSAQSITVGGTGLPPNFTIFRTSSTDNCVSAGTYTTGTSISLPAKSVVTLQAGGTPLGGGGGSRVTASETSLEVSEEAVSTRVYPNPSKNQNIIVDFSGLQRGDGPIEIKLNDVNGKAIKSYSTNENKLEINQNDLPAKGLYLLRINSGVKTERVKLLVE